LPLQHGAIKEYFRTRRIYASLVVLNQGDVLLAGQVTRRVVVKSLLTPVIPFCVTMLGAFLNTDAIHAEDLRPGKTAMRRSLLIALCVGSTIILLNQGDVLLAGAVSGPLVLVKVLVTPCVPFCVSLYGAYAAYWSALAEQQKSAR
jgi:hypothetical protein